LSFCILTKSIYIIATTSEFFKDAKYLSKKADIYYYWPILKFMKIIGKINDYKIIMI